MWKARRAAFYPPLSVFGHRRAKYVPRAAMFEVIARLFVRKAAVWNDGGVRVRTRVEKYDVTRQKYDDGAPKYDDRAPKYDDRAPKYDDKAPKYDRRAPKYACRQSRYIVAPRSLQPHVAPTATSTPQSTCARPQPKQGVPAII